MYKQIHTFILSTDIYTQMCKAQSIYNAVEQTKLISPGGRHPITDVASVLHYSPAFVIMYFLSCPGWKSSAICFTTSGYHPHPSFLLQWLFHFCPQLRAKTTTTTTTYTPESHSRRVVNQFVQANTSHERSLFSIDIYI